jgi:hypothetical protein
LIDTVLIRIKVIAFFLSNSWSSQLLFLYNDVGILLDKWQLPRLGV